MKSITIRNPWAWAVIHAGRNIHNATRLVSHRGPIAIHAGEHLGTGADFAVVTALAGRPVGQLVTGAVVGIADLVDAHMASWENCQDPEVCKPWGLRALDTPGPEGHVVHLVLENVRQAAMPIPCHGKPGIWELPPDVAKTLRAGGLIEPTDGAAPLVEDVPGVDLTPAQMETLEFARATWRSLGRRDAAILERFGHTPTRHLQKLQVLLENPAALRYDAQLVNRLRDLRDARKAARTASAPSW